MRCCVMLSSRTGDCFRKMRYRRTYTTTRDCHHRHDIDVIMAGFLWYVSILWITPADMQGEPVSQPRSRLNMFQKANDMKSNLVE